MKIFLSSITKNNLYLGIGILLFLYVVARAFMLSMTHDESLSFTIINGDDTWKYDAHTKDAIRFMAEAKKDSSLMSNHWLFEPTLKYYIKTENLPIRLSGCVETFAEPDFVYRYQDTSTIADYSLLKSFPLSNSNLMAKTKANK